ncbi:MAG TPA: tetratricopeptide repeat protein [Opitutaceae bacterium]|nr:tetratricopeptide repeat protein [Opitutaceae bacterium]
MRNTLRALVIALAATWVYSPCLRGTWLWDDGLEISQNGALRSPGGWWEPWIRPQGMDYFPLKSSLQWLEWHLWGAEPLGYHMVNLALHVLSALLVWRLLRLLGVRAAFMGGLLFAVHPVAVESVAWISEFKNTVSLPPLLLASIAYVGFDRSGRRGAKVRALLWFVAALACKTSVVMFPAVLLLHSWWRRGRIARRDLRATAPFFAAAAAMGAATVWFQSTRAIGIAGTPEGLGARVAEAGWSIVCYARMCLWPAGLAPIYPHSPGSGPATAAWLGIGAVLALFWLRRAGWGRHALLGSGWFLLNLIPVLGIIPMSYLRVSPRADHFAYLPLVGWVGLAAAGLSALLEASEKRWGRGRRVRLPLAAGAAAAVCAMALGARAHASAFWGEKTLWTLAVERNPGSWLARSNLGKVLLQEGRPADASAQFREATRLQPDSPEAHANLGNALEALDRADEARREYETALGIDPGFAGAHYDLGLSLLGSGRSEDAAGEFRRALVLDPGHAAARNSLGLALARSGRFPEAMDQYRLALKLNPELPEAHLNLGNELFRLDRMEEAVGEYREALRLNPGYSGAHANLGQALARLGRQEEAEAEFEAARNSANH